MATYYFDANGATAGFGTLTGNWNPSTALWSTSSAGTSATSAVTFTNADVAQFGFAGTTGTAGTATITTGITNTVNQVVTANLAGLQTIAGPGTLDLAGTTPTINVGSAGGLTISAPITGTAGFTKAGTADLSIGGTGAKAISGAVTILVGNILVNAGLATGTPNQLSNITSYAISGGLIYTGNAAFNETAAYSGNGLVQANLNGATMTYSGSLAGHTGYISNFTQTSSQTNAVIFSTQASFPAGSSTFSDTPGNAVTGTVFTWTYTGSGPVTQAGGNYFVFRTSTGTSTTTSEYANSSANNATVTYQGNFDQAPFNSFSGTSHTVRFNANTGNIVVSGNILAGGVTTRSVAKTGTYKTTLSGANTYTGANTVSAGTLVANNNSALGQASGVASSITTGATLEIGSGITVNKASTAWTLNGNTAANGAVYAPSGNAGLTAFGFTLGTATTDIKADAGATLTLTSAGAIGGNFTLRHIGAGTAVLAQTAASTFTALNIQSGTVSVSAALAAGGTASGIGNGSTAAANWLIGSTASAGTFRYTGAASSSNRNFTIGTAGSTFDASGSGVLTLTGTTPAFSAANTACTLTLAGMAGTSAAPNTSAMVLANNGTGAVALTKTGVGAWELSASQTYTGTTTVTGGSLAFSENNISTDVTFNGPGTLRKVVLNGVSKTITCAAGASDVAELIATSSHNTITGSTNITTGTLKLTTEAFAAGKPVKVAGDTNVSVTSKLQTSTGILQRGQMRYGGNLTFQAGSTFIIGG